VSTFETTTLTLTATHTQPVAAGTIVVFYARPDGADLAETGTCTWRMFGPRAEDERTLAVNAPGILNWDTSGLRPGAYDVRCDFDPSATPGGAPDLPEEPLGPEADLTRTAPVPGTVGSTRSATLTVFVTAAQGALSPEGVLPVSLQRTGIAPTDDQILWVVIRNRTNALAFRPYRQFIDGVLCNDERTALFRNTSNPHLYRGADAFALLRFATDVFLMHEAGVIDPDDPADFARAALHPDQVLDALETEGVETSEARRLGRTTVSVPDLQAMRDRYYQSLFDEISRDFLPYLRIIRERLSDIPLKPATATTGNCYGILRSNLAGPLAIELIWSYWQEEGMLAQTLNAILARFQNRRLRPGAVDPLARFDLDPLRPLSNLFWGWVQDEMHRLTVRRRAFEYEHEYGLRLVGRAIPSTKPVDRRSKFLESFHNLLYLAHVFFKEDDDTTVIADGFPLLNALRETHLLLAEGAHNQWGDLPSAARAEMLIMQWLLARPEMRDFLGGRYMVPYEEDWMDRVDTMKTLQGWTDVTITHFRDLAAYGEQILLTVRYGNWSVANDPQQAANWARYWRPEVQRYVHAYRAATGVDLTERVDASMPSELLHRRLGNQRRA
jgi:hypothetical protein